MHSCLLIVLLVFVFICYSGCIINDDYCDTLNGSDETTTPACSHLQQNKTFPCTSGATSSAEYLNISIPFSRVGDGVCDCCDGSDEIGFVLPHQCNNTCDQTLEITRREAMVAYITAKNGKEQRNTISERVNRKRLQDERTLAQLVVRHVCY
jgi:protein kinase C substrate 80K-H